MVFSSYLPNVQKICVCAEVGTKGNSAANMTCGRVLYSMAVEPGKRSGARVGDQRQKGALAPWRPTRSDC